MKNKRESEKLKSTIIEEYLNTPEVQRSLTQLQKKYGVKRQTISKWLKEKNIEVINHQNRLRLDESIFDKINTEEKAYWLGFIFADGNISSEGYRFEMNLSIVDIDHMEKFREFLKLETEIKVSKNYGNGNMVCRLSARNVRIWNSLNNLGCTPKKSLTLKFPNINDFSNKQFIYDFIRGYCDGDGSLGLYNYKNTKNSQVSMVGTYEFLYKLREFLGISGYIRNKSCADYKNNAFELKYTGVNARKVARLLYENSSIYLERKYKIYKYFCQFEEESSKRKSSKISRSWDANTEVSSEMTKGSETPQRVESE